jgi:hypothetical protein
VLPPPKPKLLGFHPRWASQGGVNIPQSRLEEGERRQQRCRQRGRHGRTRVSPGREHHLRPHQPARTYPAGAETRRARRNSPFRSGAEEPLGRPPHRAPVRRRHAAHTTEEHVMQQLRSPPAARTMPPALRDAAASSPKLPIASDGAAKTQPPPSSAAAWACPPAAFGGGEADGGGGRSGRRR